MPSQLVETWKKITPAQMDRELPQVQAIATQRRCKGNTPGMKEQTLVLVKPDGLVRGLTGEILQRFEKAGLKIVAMKLVKPTEAQALMHYTEDITVRRGAAVRKNLVEFLQSAPLVALVLEGIH